MFYTCFLIFILPITTLIANPEFFMVLNPMFFLLSYEAGEWKWRGEMW